jgi:hypothetical protein
MKQMQEYFWSVCLEENSIQAAIWTIHANTAEIIDVSNSSNWDSDETLISSADACLSSCIQKLPEDASEPTKTVFGVPSSWVSDGQIEKQYLDKIKVLSQKLSLTPTGFVVLPEAISHFKKQVEKTPVSAILVGIYSQTVDISVFRLGNIAGSVKVARSTNLVDDVIEGFARFGNQEPFPSRFILYDSKESTLEDARQDLIKADWDQLSHNVKFLHTPQVEIIKQQEKMAAISLAGAAEISKATDISFRIQEEGVADLSEASPVETFNTETESNIEGMVDASTLGFTSNIDLTEPNHPGETTQTHAVNNRFKLPNFNMAFIKNFKLPIRENMLFIGAVAILILIIVLFGAWWSLPKAEVTIYIAPEKIENNEKVTYDVNATSVDSAKKIVPAKEQSTNVTADKTKTTSGTKTVGTPSKGSVTFYNVGDATSISAGTALTSSSLEFVLDSDISIASASGAASAATATGNIASAGVGADYNLAGGTFFNVAGYSSNTLQAKNDNSLSGGSSQEVPATSQDDVDSLTKDLTTQLTTNGKDNLKQSLDGGSLLLENTVKATTANKTLDHDVGEEATTVKLSLTAKISGLTVTRNDMNSLAKSLYSNQVPSGFSMKDDQIDFMVNGKDTHFIINLLPTIDTIKIANQISGKNVDDAKKILSKLPGFTDVDVQITPNLFNLPILPHIANNISVTLSAKK